jgi:hypothetical protein
MWLSKGEKERETERERERERERQKRDKEHLLVYTVIPSPFSFHNVAI